MSIVGQVIAAIVAVLIGIIGLGITIEITKLFVGHSFSEHGLFLLVIPMAGISCLASFGRKSSVAAVEVLVIFTFVAFAMIFANVAGPVMFLILAGVYAAIYGPPTVRACHYLFVTRPVEVEALKQRTLSDKLGADSALAEATLRHERALAALADADRRVAEVEQRVAEGGP